MGKFDFDAVNMAACDLHAGGVWVVTTPDSSQHPRHSNRANRRGGLRKSANRSTTGGDTPEEEVETAPKEEIQQVAAPAALSAPSDLMSISQYSLSSGKLVRRPVILNHSHQDMAFAVDLLYEVGGKLCVCASASACEGG